MRVLLREWQDAWPRAIDELRLALAAANDAGQAGDERAEAARDESTNVRGERESSDAETDDAATAASATSAAANAPTAAASATSAAASATSAAASVTTAAAAASTSAAAPKPSRLSARLPPLAADAQAHEIVQAKVEQFLRKRDEQGLRFNAHLRSLKSFRNPAILDKLVTHYGIDEHGTQLDAAVWDIAAFKALDDYKALGERIKQWELEEAARRSGAPIEFVQSRM